MQVLSGKWSINKKPILLFKTLLGAQLLASFVGAIYRKNFDHLLVVIGPSDKALFKGET